MDCKNCKSKLPEKRVVLGYKYCTTCSTEEVYGTIDIVYHKTGNTVQHVSKETADKINKDSRRSGFGSSLGKIKSGGPSEFTRKLEVGCSTSTIGSEGLYQQVHDRVELFYETFGYTKAAGYIGQALNECKINTQQANKLKRMLDILVTL